MSETSKRVLATDWSEPTDEGSVARACVTLAHELEAAERKLELATALCVYWQQPRMTAGLGESGAGAVEDITSDLIEILDDKGET